MGMTMTRLFFSDGILAGHEIPWFGDVYPSKMIQFPISNTNPPQTVFYKVTEDFNKGRRVMATPTYQELYSYHKSIIKDVVEGLKKDAQKERREIIWNSFGFICCIGWLITDLIDAYNGQLSAIFWQFFGAILFVFSDWKTKVSIQRFKKFKYAAGMMTQVSETENLSRTEMLSDQAIHALNQAATVGIPTLPKFLTKKL